MTIPLLRHHALFCGAAATALALFAGPAPAQNRVCVATQPAASILSGTAPISMSSALFPLEKLCNSMDFVHPDSAPQSVMNQVLWKSVKGVHSKMPAIRHSARLLGTAKPVIRAARKDGDD